MVVNNLKGMKLGFRLPHISDSRKQQEVEKLVVNSQQGRTMGFPLNHRLHSRTQVPGLGKESEKAELDGPHSLEYRKSTFHQSTNWNRMPQTHQGMRQMMAGT